jgi:hypothetical protein
MPKIFREQPPLTLVEEFIKCLNLQGIDDSTWFSKSCIRLVEFEALLPELEPYYIPCKSEYVHNPLTQARAITVLRQLIHSHKRELIAQEKTCGGVKGMWYKLQGSSGVVHSFN